MKKLFIYSIAATLVLAACNKTDRVFNESPDTRLNAVMVADQKALMGAPYGWRGYIFPKGLNGGVVGFYFNFKDTNRVEMFSDWDSTSAVTVQESSWRLKALQQPALLFDTYNYVHVLSDPDGSVNGGSYGSGLQSDFEFAIDTLKGDTIKLTGRFNGCAAYLIKATQAEHDNYYAKKVNNRVLPNNYGKILTYFHRITLNGKVYEVQVDLASHSVTFTWIDGNGVAQTKVVGFYYTATGVGLFPAFTDGTNTIGTLDNISFNTSTTTFSFTVNGTTATLAPAIAPVNPDKTSYTRFKQYATNNGGYWISENNFHVNGVDDYYGITKLPDYYYTLYWPGQGPIQGTSVYYDIFAPIQLERDTANLHYGDIYRSPTASSTDGRWTLGYLVDAGDLNKPSLSDSAIVAQTRPVMSNTRGFYFVQIDAKTYDQVAASDAKSWIRWIWIF